MKHNVHDANRRIEALELELRNVFNEKLPVNLSKIRFNNGLPAVSVRFTSTTQRALSEILEAVRGHFGKLGVRCVPETDNRLMIWI